MIGTLGQIAVHVGGELFGDPAREILAVRPLDTAGPSDLSFLTLGRYVAEARKSRAAALLVGKRRTDVTADQIVVRNPALALARVIELFHPVQPSEPGVHATAIVALDAQIDPTAHVGPYAVIGARTRIEGGATVHAHVVVGADCVVGPGATLHPHVVLYSRVRLAGSAVVHAGSVLGADGFGYASDGARHHKIPQVGGVEIGEEVEIGALSAIDRAVLDDTTVGAGTKIDNLVQVGHNVRIGRAVLISGMTGLAGSARVGDGAVISGQVGIGGHFLVGAGSQVAAQSLVIAPTAPGAVVAGSPATAIGQWRRQQALLRRLGEIWRRLRALERRAGIESGAVDGEEESD